MTLDDLIETLEELRRRCPASATARVVGVFDDDIRYEGGEVCVFPADDDDEDDNEAL